MPANQNADEPATDDEPSNDPENYHPARNVSPGAIEQAMATLGDGGVKNSSEME